MDIFSNWLHENIDPKYEAKMKLYGYTYVDSLKTPNYTMFLLKNDFLPTQFKYQVALERFDTDAFDYDSQADHDKKDRERINLDQQYGTIQVMFNKFMEWIKKYKDICVASSQNAKTTKWVNTIQYLGGDSLNIKQEMMMGHRIFVISEK